MRHRRVLASVLVALVVASGTTVGRVADRSTVPRPMGVEVSPDGPRLAPVSAWTSADELEAGSAFGWGFGAAAGIACFLALECAAAGAEEAKRDDDD